MDDTNLIATLVAEDPHSLASAIISHPDNFRRRTQYSSNPTSVVGFELKFSTSPIRPGGFKIGTDSSTCDLIVPAGQITHGINPVQCGIGFNERQQLVLVDLREANANGHGIAVMYDSRPPVVGGQFRFGDRFTWVLAGAEFTDRAKCIIIQIHQYVRFRLIVSNSYRANVENHFKQPLAREPASTLSWYNMSTQPLSAITGAVMAPNARRLWLGYGSLGNGTYGGVTAVVDVSSGRVFARKSFTGNFDTIAFEREIFEKEGANLSRLQHDNIVRLELYEPNPAAIYMEYADGGNLRKSHQRAPIPRLQVVSILRQLLDALAYAHSLGCGHRDIKPENILVAARDQENIKVKLADFGMSKFKTEPNQLFNTIGVGTPCYTAPEIIRKQAYDLDVDIWSVGVTVLELAIGFPAMPKTELGWTRALIERLRQCREDSLADFLRQHMVIDAPKKRSSAQACLSLSNDLVQQHQPTSMVPYAPPQMMSGIVHHGNGMSATPATILRPGMQTRSSGTSGTSHSSQASTLPSASTGQTIAAYFGTSAGAMFGTENTSMMFGSALHEELGEQPSLFQEGALSAWLHASVRDGAGAPEGPDT